MKTGDRNPEVGLLYRPLTFGEATHLLRRKRGMTIEDVSNKTGYSAGAISQVERDRKPPTPRIVDALITAIAPDDDASDGLAALAAETYRRIELNLDGLDRERIEIIVQLRRRIGSLRPEALEAIRAALAPET